MLYKLYVKKILQMKYSYELIYRKCHILFHKMILFNKMNFCLIGLQNGDLFLIMRKKN